ncbi:hypothetical protein [Streptomyces sp. NPDC001851]
MRLAWGAGSRRAVLRRPRAARGLQAGTGAALTVLGAALLLEPLLP